MSWRRVVKDVTKSTAYAALGLLAATGAAAGFVWLQNLRKAPEHRLSLVESIVVYLSRRRTQCVKRFRPKRIILIRHGESEGNVNKALYATIPDNKMQLTEKGVAQAYVAGEVLRELVNDERIFFYTSPFLRARQTLRQIIDGGGWQLDGAGKRLLEANPDSPTDWAGHMDNFSTPKPHTLGRHAPSRPTGAVVGIRSDPRLRELEFGNKQDPARMAEVMRERQAHGRFYYRFRSGESGCDVYDRMSSFWASLYRQMDNFGRPYVENVVIVAHGLTMRLFLMRYFQWPVSFFETVWNPDNCEMYVLEQEQGVYRLTTPLTVGQHRGIKTSTMPLGTSPDALDEETG